MTSLIAVQAPVARVEMVGADIVKEVEVVDFVVTQRTETNEHRDFKEFLVPTAQELERLIHGGTRKCLSTPTNEQNNHFASLLNQGSSLE